MDQRCSYVFPIELSQTQCSAMWPGSYKCLWDHYIVWQHCQWLSDLLHWALPWVHIVDTLHLPTSFEGWIISPSARKKMKPTETHAILRFFIMLAYSALARCQSWHVRTWGQTNLGLVCWRGPPWSSTHSHGIPEWEEGERCQEEKGHFFLFS